jgi:hypothetical protein
MSYSQNQEDLFVLNYFKGYTGNLLSVGENNGTDLSNAKLLIQNNWNATLLEPGNIFHELQNLHLINERIQCLNIGIGDKDEAVLFWESGAHVPYGTDRGLVSSANYSETERWRKMGVQFDETQINLVTFKSFMNLLSMHRTFDFISIDAEGFDWKILKQIDLDEVKCKCLCIEWNGDIALWHNFNDYCSSFGMKLAIQNCENLIFIK